MEYVELEKSEQITLQSVHKEVKENREVLNFLVENCASKADMNELRVELKADIQDVRSDLKRFENRIINHIDGFIGLYKDQRDELAALGMRVTRLEEAQK